MIADVVIVMETSISNFQQQKIKNKELYFRNKRDFFEKKKFNPPVKSKLHVIILSIVPQVKVTVKFKENFFTQNLKINIKCNDNSTCL